MSPFVQIRGFSSPGVERRGQQSYRSAVQAVKATVRRCEPVNRSVIFRVSERGRELRSSVRLDDALIACSSRSSLPIVSSSSIIRCKNKSSRTTLSFHISFMYNTIRREEGPFMGKRRPATASPSLAPFATRDVSSLSHP